MIKDKLPGIVIALILIAIGCAILRYGVLLVIRSFNGSDLFDSRGIPAEAVISEIYRSPGSPGRSFGKRRETITIVYMTFTDHTGNEYKVQTRNYDFTMREGMKIKIVYNADNPDEFVITGLIHNFLVLLLFCICGLPFLVLGILALRRLKNMG